jgi:AraC family transcriptional regulator
MDLAAPETKRFSPTSPLLASSAALGWSGLSAELRSHGVRGAETEPAVPADVEVILILAGNPGGLVRRNIAGLVQEAAPNTGLLWLSPAGVRKDSTIVAPVPRALHINLQGQLFDRLKNDFSLSIDEAQSIRPAAGISDSVINQIGRSILTELAAETSASRVFVETAAVTLAARLVQKYSDGSAGVTAEASEHGFDQGPLRRALDYIEDNLSEDIALDSLAQVAGYSVFHFARKFALAMGVSPGRYISQKRLENAKTELAAGKLALVEIALNAQFSSQASFTRAFHRATGMTPMEYRRRRCW